MRLTNACCAQDTNIGIMGNLSAVARAEHIENQHFLRLLFITVRVIAGQGLALRGHEEKDSNFINILEGMMEATGKYFNTYKTKDKYCSPVAQNEILEMFYRHVMREKVKKINDCGHFCLMADEDTDVSNTELLSAAVRQCNDKLECSEIWLGYQTLDNIKSQTVKNGLKVS